MDTIFFPPKRRGLIFQTLALLILSLGSLFSILQATQVDVGPSFALSLFSLLVFALPLPVLAYRIYALQRASYQVSPEGIRLNWGLRTEDIPMEKILWLSRDAHLERPLLAPWVYWPGSVLGVRQVKGGAVEYMAAQTHPLIVIATVGKMYAISPESPEIFLQTFQRQAETGTLSPISSRSVYPTVLLGSVWVSRAARFTILSGLVFSLILLGWIALTPATDFNLLPLSDVSGNETPAISPTQLRLLPVVNALFFLGNFLLGLFFFRRPQSQPLAFLLWGTSILTSLLFLVAFYTFLQG